MPAYPLNPPPDARCDCGPALICTHALVPTDPAGTTPVDTNRQPGGPKPRHRNACL